MPTSLQRAHPSRQPEISDVSPEYSDGFPADVYVVDGQGARVAAPLVKEVQEGGRRHYEIRLPGDHFAILVKKGP